MANPPAAARYGKQPAAGSQEAGSQEADHQLANHITRI